MPCTLGGRIKIFYTFESASASAGISSEEKRSLWSKALDFDEGLGTGLWKGLKGSVTGVVELALWANKHTPTYMLLNPAGYVEQGLKDIETLISLGKMADKAANMSAEEWGDFAGQVLFEVGTEVATAGGAATLTAIKATDKVVDAAKAANRLDDVMDAAKAVDKADDAMDAAKALDNVKVPKLTNPVMRQVDDIPIKTKQKTYTHGQSDGGPGTWENRTTPKKGADYQEHVTGAPKDTEYVVKTDKMKSGEKKFDGYEPETNTLMDAKDWDKWPPEGDAKFDNFARDKEVANIKKDAQIAADKGANLEHHVPTETKKNQLLEMLGDDIPENFDIKVTPKD